MAAAAASGEPRLTPIPLFSVTKCRGGLDFSQGLIEIGTRWVQPLIGHRDLWATHSPRVIGKTRPMNLSSSERKGVGGMACKRHSIRQVLGALPYFCYALGTGGARF